MRPAFLLPLAALILLAGCAPKTAPQTSAQSDAPLRINDRRMGHVTAPAMDPIVNIWLPDGGEFTKGVANNPGKYDQITSFTEYRLDGTVLSVVHFISKTGEDYAITRGTWSRVADTLTIQIVSDRIYTVSGPPRKANPLPENPKPSLAQIEVLTVDKLTNVVTTPTGPLRRSYLRGAYPPRTNPHVWIQRLDQG
jgi:hypothetical protein